jgi:sporulation protein YlmC with PRC-barrel domain
LRWENAVGRLVTTASGRKLGLLRDMYLSSRGGAITHLEITPPRSFLLLRGELLQSPIRVTTEAATSAADTIVVPDDFQTANTGAIRGLPRISGLPKAEVFAGRGWRIGSLVEIHIEVDSWKITGLDVDVYPEYLVSSGRHTAMLPRGFPPVCVVRVGGEGVEFHPADPVGRTFSVILSLKGSSLEDSLQDLLLRIGNEILSEEQQADLVQEAFDIAHREGRKEHSSRDQP